MAIPIILILIFPDLWVTPWLITHVLIFLRGMAILSAYVFVILLQVVILDMDLNMIFFVNNSLIFLRLTVPVHIIIKIMVIHRKKWFLLFYFLRLTFFKKFFTQILFFFSVSWAWIWIHFLINYRFCVSTYI